MKNVKEIDPYLRKFSYTFLFCKIQVEELKKIFLLPDQINIYDYKLASDYVNLHLFIFDWHYHQ